ncbi:hypothetical protein D3C72_2458100 [compost metagenome]
MLIFIITRIYLETGVILIILLLDISAIKILPLMSTSMSVGLLKLEVPTPPRVLPVLPVPPIVIT